jgi:hypothetical protein
MLSFAEARENDEEYMSALDMLFEALEREEGPEHIAVKQYKVYRQAKGKTASSILVSLAVRLAPFNIPQIQRITGEDEMDLWSLGEEKAALFAVYRTITRPSTSWCRCFTSRRSCACTTAPTKSITAACPGMCGSYSTNSRR